MDKKILVFIGVSIISAFAARAEDPANDLTGTLAKVRETGSIVLGYRKASFPFSYVNSRFQPEGYTKDLCDKIMDDLKARLEMSGLKVDYLMVTPQNHLSMLKEGVIDMECGTTGNSVARNYDVSFSVNYFVSDIRMLSRYDSNINTLDDLNEQTVVTTVGSLTHDFFAKNLDITQRKINVYYGYDHNESLLMLKTGYAVAFFLDDVVLEGLIKTSRDPNAYKISDISFGKKYYVILFRKGDEMMKKFVDKSLSDLMTSGQVEAIYNKWFMKYLPSTGVEFNRPMRHDMWKIFLRPTDAIPNN
ncbi:MAG: amino acid ABC transporter substrate-binding protein [Candidatus Accumulibacter sp.]|nr:amino acid ABC transporter substrate-binding protein [Accumulibacter sp.]